MSDNPIPDTLFSEIREIMSDGFPHTSSDLYAGSQHAETAKQVCRALYTMRSRGEIELIPPDELGAPPGYNQPKAYRIVHPNDEIELLPMPDVVEDRMPKETSDPDHHSMVDLLVRMISDHTVMIASIVDTEEMDQDPALNLQFVHRLLPSMELAIKCLDQYICIVKREAK